MSGVKAKWETGIFPAYAAHYIGGDPEFRLRTFEALVWIVSRDMEWVKGATVALSRPMYFFDTKELNMALSVAFDLEREIARVGGDTSFEEAKAQLCAAVNDGLDVFPGFPLVFGRHEVGNIREIKLEGGRARLVEGEPIPSGDGDNDNPMERPRRARARIAPVRLVDAYLSVEDLRATWPGRTKVGRPKGTGLAAADAPLVAEMAELLNTQPTTYTSTWLAAEAVVDRGRGASQEAIIKRLVARFKASSN